MTFLLDTNVCVQVLRHRDTVLTNRMQSIGPAQIVTCSIVRAELLSGALRTRDPAATISQVEAFLRPFVSLPFDDAAAAFFARIRHALESVGKPIGPYDTMIAAIAMAHGATVVTGNVSEFGRVPGLLMADWR